MRPFDRNSVLPLVLILALAGCADTVEQSREHSDAPLSPIGLEEELQIGTIDGPQAYQFFQVTAVQQADDGFIYVLDGGNRSVRVFDPTGTFVRDFGREGDGPGEFHNPTVLGVAADTVVVLERVAPAPTRVHSFSVTGEALGSFNIGESFDFPTGAVRTPEGWIVAMTRTFQAGLGQQSLQRGPYFDSLFVRLVDLGTATAREPVVTVVGREYYLLGELGWVRSPFLAPQPRIALSPAGEIHIISGADYAIEVAGRDGLIVRRIDQSVDPIPVTERDFAQALAAELADHRGRPANSESSRLIAMLENEYPTIPRAIHRPVLGRLLASTSGHLLVERLDLDPAPLDASQVSYWDLIEPSGERAGTVTIPRSVVPLYVTDTHVFARVRDQLDVQYVVKYRLAVQ